MKHKYQTIIFFFLTLGSFFQTAYAALSLKEKEIQHHVQQEHVLPFLKKIIETNSGTTNIKGVIRTGERIRKELNALGFKTKWIKEPASMHKAPTLIAEKEGKSAKRILLIGHLDTVFAANSAFKKLTIKKQAAHGPGALDDKGGIVVMLSALKALQAAHVLKDIRLTIVLTGDEESSGKPATISRQPLFQAAKDSDVALDFEPAVTLNTATVARRGIEQWTVKTQGVQAHSAAIFEKGIGDGAIFEAARILNEIRTQLQPTGMSFNAGIMLGGSFLQFHAKTAMGEAFGKENIIAAHALVKGDLRFLNDEERKQAEKTMQTIVAAHLPETSATIQFEAGSPAMLETPNNLALLALYSTVSEDLGEGSVKALPPKLRGAGDISYIANKVRANLSGLGPTGSQEHSSKETLDLSSLPIQATRAAILIYRLSQS